MAYSKYPKRKNYANRWYNSKPAAVIAKKGMSIAKMAASAYLMAKGLKKASNIEYKAADVQDLSNANYSGYIATLNNIPQGATDSSRVGDSIKLQTVTIRGQLGRVTSDSTCRVILFWDKQNKVTTASDILQYVGSSYAPFSDKYYDKRFQTKIFYDKVFTLDSNSPLRPFKIVKRIGLHTQFEAGSNTINTGVLRLLFISNVNANTPSLQYNSHLTYTDD